MSTDDDNSDARRESDAYFRLLEESAKEMLDSRVVIKVATEAYARQLPKMFDAIEERIEATLRDNRGDTEQAKVLNDLATDLIDQMKVRLDRVFDTPKLRTFLRTPPGTRASESEDGE